MEAGLSENMSTRWRKMGTVTQNILDVSFFAMGSESLLMVLSPIGDKPDRQTKMVTAVNACAIKYKHICINVQHEWLPTAKKGLASKEHQRRKKRR